MTDVSVLRTQFNRSLEQNSVPLRFKYYSVANAANIYDDNQALTQSGTDVWTSGCVQAINAGESRSQDALLLEQGKILMQDKRVYLPHDADTSGTWKMGVGSPVVNEFAMVPDGVHPFAVNNDIVYKKVFVRVLPTGSFANE